MNQDIKKMRDQIQIGDMIRTEIKIEEYGTRLLKPIWIYRKVVAKYPYIIELDRSSSKRETITYANLISGKGKLCSKNLENLIQQRN